MKARSYARKASDPECRPEPGLPVKSVILLTTRKSSFRLRCARSSRAGASTAPLQSRTTDRSLRLFKVSNSRTCSPAAGVLNRPPRLFKAPDAPGRARWSNQSRRRTDPCGVPGSTTATDTPGGSRHSCRILPPASRPQQQKHRRDSRLTPPSRPVVRESRPATTACLRSAKTSAFADGPYALSMLRKTVCRMPPFW